MQRHVIDLVDLVELVMPCVKPHFISCTNISSNLLLFHNTTHELVIMGEQPFPMNATDLAADSRVYQSLRTGKFLIEDDDGHEYEWQVETSKWKKASEDTLDEEREDEEEEDDELAAFNKAYERGVVSEGNPVASKKRKLNEAVDREAKKRKEEEAQRAALPRAVYVTNLPLDTDAMEIYNVFSAAGLIDESWDTDKPRIKMYNHPSGEFKGEALIVYYKPESVSQAVSLLHATDFRQGKHVAGNLDVSIADQSYKTHDTETIKDDRKRKPLSKKQLQKIKDKKVDMDKRLEWNSSDDEDIDQHPQRPRPNRWERLVIIKGMFTLEQLAADPTLYHEIKDDLREQCELFGEVTSIVVYDEEPNGIATVRFADVDAADQCQKRMNGRSYDGRVLKASISNGFEQFKKSPPDEKADAERLEAYRKRTVDETF